LATISALKSQLLRAQGRGPQRKVVIVSLGHSLDPITSGGRYQWLPSMDASGIQSMSNFLAPLNPFRDRMLAVAGIDNLIPRMVASNGHNASSRTLLSAVPHAEYTGMGSRMNSQSKGGGPSIEYVIAQRLNQNPLTLRAGVTNGEHRRTFLADGTDDQGNPDPRSAFENLFASFSGSGGALSAAEQLQARRADILGTVRNTYDATAARAGAEDRERLQSHAFLIDNLINELDAVPVSNCSTAPQLNIPNGYPSDFGYNDHNNAGRSDHLVVPVHNSLIATAFGCGAASVASLHYSTMQSNQFPFLNGGQDLIAQYGMNWHSFCHHEGGAPDEVRVAAQRWYSEMFADLLRKLEQAPDVNGSVLDNTIVVFLSSLGAASHSTNDIPFLLFGGANSGIQTNRVVDYRSNSRSTGDMWTTLLRLMGQTDDSFGMQGSVDGRAFNSGPLSELMS